MSNYTLAVNWSGKDALADDAAGKVVSGSDFNTEFTTVQTAVNSKANLNGAATESFAIDDATVAGTLTVGETLTVTGIPTIPTASAGTNTTQAASTAFVTTAVAALDQAAINNLVYPVGSIYTNMAVATNPATLLGMGTWVAYGEGRVLVGKASSGTFDALNEELGFETHELSVDELPAHGHSQNSSGGSASIQFAQNAPSGNPRYASGAGLDTTRSVGDTGGGQAHSNLQPSITVYMWKRTA
tara:strand:+ start:1304 stop:2032 length:729 start_codon:yes stop_codon:yes gene_type:complete